MSLGSFGGLFCGWSRTRSQNQYVSDSKYVYYVHFLHKKNVFRDTVPSDLDIEIVEKYLRNCKHVKWYKLNGRVITVEWIY